MKKNLKKVFSLLTAGLMIVGLAAGCSSTPAATPVPTNPPAAAVTPTTAPADVATPAPAAATPVTVNVAKWADGSDQTKDPDYQVVQTWNAAHPDIQINLDIIPSDGYGTKLTTSFSSGDGYDIFESGEGDFAKWVAQGVNQPLDSFIAADSSYNTSLFSQSVYHMGNINGKQYYVIKDYNPMVLYYNKSMFDNAGLAYPDANTTWDTIFADAAKMTDTSKNTFGINATSWTYALYCYLWSNGVDIADPTGTIVDGYMNSANTVSVLDRWLQASVPGPNKISPTGDEANSLSGQETMMANNLLGMFLSGYWSVDTFKTAGFTGYGTTVMPKDNAGDQASILMAAGFCMSNQCKNTDAAWQVLKMLSSADTQQVRMTLQGVLPTTQTLLDQLKASMPASDQGVIDVLPMCQQPIGLRSPIGNTIDTDFNNAVQLVVTGTNNTQDAMNAGVAAVAADTAAAN